MQLLIWTSGPMHAAMRRLQIPSMPNAMRVTAVTAANRSFAGGRHHVQFARRAATAAAGATSALPCLARRYGAARRSGLDGVSLFLAGEVAPPPAYRLSQWEYHHSSGGHAGARHRHDLGCRHPDL